MFAYCHLTLGLRIHTLNGTDTCQHSATHTTRTCFIYADWAGPACGGVGVGRAAAASEQGLRRGRRWRRGRWWRGRRRQRQRQRQRRRLRGRRPRALHTSRRGPRHTNRLRGSSTAPPLLVTRTSHRRTHSRSKPPVRFTGGRASPGRRVERVHAIEPSRSSSATSMAPIVSPIVSPPRLLSRPLLQIRHRYESGAARSSSFVRSPCGGVPTCRYAPAHLLRTVHAGRQPLAQPFGAPIP